MDVSPKQLVSVAASLIPFLEHDDANRALMGSNMQRQAVPLLITEAPLVATGLEERVARDSRAVIVAEEAGKVASITGSQIIITDDGKVPEGKKKIRHDPAKGIYVYQVRKFMRSNAATCINQKILVKKGEAIKKGQVIADGPCTQGGELALGRNVLVAFMPWNGYNFEDAILVSERIVKDDVFTSIHIDEFEVGARDTKLGPEEITRDIPNLGDEALKNLGPDGVIRIGAEVKPGDILVGKITPKSETELAPEERLLRAIFGEKAADVKDTSLKVPSGTYGIVMDVKVSSKKDSDREVRAVVSEEKRHAKEVEEDHRKKTDELREQLTEALSNILLGEKIPLDVVNSETGEIIIPANRKITKTLLRKLAQVYDRIEIDPSPIRNKINEIIGSFKKKFDDLQMQYDEELERAESGEGVESGVIKSVKVYIASKRKLSVGDKMAGRHGNKGVVAKIVADEDMPFLNDGTPVDIVLNPLGVPSRMNVGQVLETHLGWAAKLLGLRFATPVFDGIKEKEIRGYLKDAKLPEHGKTKLIDGRTGEQFDQEIVVGSIYMMKLGHLVADKIHARAVGPYSLVTQQPLGGKAQYGGQRFGEMEVWAMEAYGAAYTLQELLTVKSGRRAVGRTRMALGGGGGGGAGAFVVLLPLLAAAYAATRVCFVVLLLFRRAHVIYYLCLLIYYYLLLHFIYYCIVPFVDNVAVIVNVFLLLFNVYLLHFFFLARDISWPAPHTSCITATLYLCMATPLLLPLYLCYALLFFLPLSYLCPFIFFLLFTFLFIFLLPLQKKNMH